MSDARTRAGEPSGPRAGDALADEVAVAELVGRLLMLCADLVPDDVIGTALPCDGLALVRDAIVDARRSALGDDWNGLRLVLRDGRVVVLRVDALDPQAASPGWMTLVTDRDA